MKTNEKAVEVLNDLIRINNDRIVGYEKAADETEGSDADLRNTFYAMASDSRAYVADLSKHTTQQGGDPATGTTTSGKVYRAWMDVKATFSGKGRKAILASCEYGEDQAQKAYEEALEEGNELSPELRQLISSQKASLKTAHDKIKRMRDAQPA